MWKLTIGLFAMLLAGIAGGLIMTPWHFLAPLVVMPGAWIIGSLAAAADAYNRRPE